MAYGKHTQYKTYAYQQNALIFRRLTGHSRIPDGQQYWTLANLQEGDDAEIAYYSRLGFLQSEQFHGVDLKQDLIDRNRASYPTAHWYHGDWNDVITNHNDFHPACIYLDTNCWCDRYSALRMVTRTLLLAPPQCVVFINVMVNDPRGGNPIDVTKLAADLSLELPPEELDRWFEPGQPMMIESYTYNSAYTEMRTFVFHRKR